MAPVVWDEVDPPTDAQVGQLFTYLGDSQSGSGRPRSRHLPMLRHIAYTGARIGEATGMRWGDLRDGAWHVERQITFVDGQPLERKPKGGRGRTVVLTSVHRDMLAEHRTAWAKEHGRIPGPDDLVFPSADLTPARANNIRRAMRKACDELDIPRVRPHMLRHYAATVALAAGVQPRIVMSIFGWRSPAMLARYQHATDEMLADAAVLLDDHHARQPG